MLPIIIGTILAVAMALLARVAGFDRDRSYYATVLMAIASYYVLFAVVAREAIVAEILVASVFFVVAIAGALRWPLLIGIGLFMHGVFDLFHSQFISNSGVPIWWPEFCLTVDALLGLWVIYLVRKRARTSTP